jgi:hypothetical protein
VKAYALKPGTFVDVIELLLPELRKRGLFQDDYAVPGGTYRENLYGQKGLTAPPLDHPAAKYQWRAGVAEKDHQIPQEPKSNGVSKKPENKRPLESDSPKSEQPTRKSARISS